MAGEEHAFGGWRVAADTGGTFTDVMGERGDGPLRRIKVLSSGALRLRVESAERWCARVPGAPEAPDGFFAGYRVFSVNGEPRSIAIRTSRSEPAELVCDGRPDPPLRAGDTLEIGAGEEAPVLGARLLTGTPLDRAIPCDEFRLATTRGTNALLERKGARAAFFVNAGHADLLRIGDQKRPDLFALDPARPEPLHASVVEVAGRLGADGEELEPLDEQTLAESARAARDEGCEVAAVALLHAYRNPEHERRVGAILREAGFRTVALSAELAPLIKILPRAETAVVDAYLGPVLETYLQRVGDACSGGPMRVMTSAGGLVGREPFRAKDSLLSGPAGGVAGVAAVGERAGYRRLIAFDMGGTSTDVARYDGGFDYVGRLSVGAASLLAPAMKVETVAAGGGSICGARDGIVFVGPESAGADPGPACYGCGGPLTVTDVNLLLGRLPTANFGIPVDAEAARARFREARSGLEAAESDDALLEGFLRIANQRMADAIRSISVREGYDPAAFALLAFGGAGGQHACAIADQLGMIEIVSPADAGLLSAYGLRRARVERVRERQWLTPWDETAAGALERAFAAMEREARSELEAEGVASVEVARREVFFRFSGQETDHAVAHEGGKRLAERFRDFYAGLFGYVPEGRDLEITRLRLIASSRGEAETDEAFAGDARAPPEPDDRQSVFAAGAWLTAAVYRRDRLPAGARVDGPAFVADAYSSLWIEPGWRGVAGDRGSVALSRAGGEPGRGGEASRAIRRELFAHRLDHIVEEMGEQLRRTALSTNIKERLDFSCAVLDAEGRLITNAPHIPVHLGAMGLCVRRVAERLRLGPGDVAITNHPGWGGSHLPDVTLVTPVFDRGERLLGYVANRAHHAELGGSRPGSMPPGATSLAEEGVAIEPRLVFEGGDNRLAETRELLENAPHPSRAVDDNMADLDAQVAANRLGARDFAALAEAVGGDAASGFMRDIHDRAREAMRRRFEPYAGKTLEAEERLDDGAALRAKFRFSDAGVQLDFAGTSPTHPANFNATPAIVRSALVYVFRLLAGDTVPLNEGLLAGTRIDLPEGTLLNPAFPDAPEACPAVVAGNVEVSQRLVDLLLKPFGLAACSQGTMNNLVFGAPGSPSYYETICGGAGAEPECRGASAVHTHMTNTAITDPEVFEHRYPVRLRRFASRPGSGGAGERPGGDGAIREIEFLRPQRLSLLTQHRRERPYGLEGGEPGAPGRQWIVRADGSEHALEGCDSADMAPGDILRVETPGGGGWGAANARR